MNFFGREKELEILRREEELSASSARFTIVMGRRRIGKTSLIRRNFQGRQCLYILAKNEAEATFCSSIQRQIQRELGISVYGSVRSMRDILDILFSYATQNQLNLVIDEVQEFFYVRKSIFADMQELWDKYKSDMKINFITCGSIYSLMKELSGLAAVQHSNTETDSKALSSCLYSGGFTLSLYADRWGGKIYRNIDGRRCFQERTNAYLLYQ